MSAALRARVAKGITQVITQGKSLTEVLPNFDTLENKDKALARELTFGSLRQYIQLKAISEQLLKKPLKDKDSDILCLILLGLYQLFYTRIPDHAVLSETVQAAVKIKKPWAKGLINALLRNGLREKDKLFQQITKEPATAAGLPHWIFEQLSTDWPDNFSEICSNSHQRAPLTLRVNIRHNSRDQYLERLQKKGINASTHPLAKQALILEKSCDVKTLPGYLNGDFSVQDAAAQMAAQLLELQPHHRILDACAAPGGKSAHMLELTDNQACLLALDNSASRLERLEENMKRLKLNADTIVADGIATDSWFNDMEPFDRILCDAPCSALGIMRRHPDIPLLRRQTDIPALAKIQQQLLTALWPLLKPGGILIYSTCSILKAENQQQVENFLRHQPDATLLNIDESTNRDWQIFPGELQMDGFYYAKLLKQA
ncbi:MAG: 16S rRNA (cytosine(967)-C(5))-methyltransferase [Gammaproteobacteria bacterium]|nr:MAG: 16S rRNA (cytosine(967)-C(5))-methyltransferase [Gammaproteobacteria bacterium]